MNAYELSINAHGICNANKILPTQKQLPTEYKHYDLHTITLVSPNATGQTGIPDWSDWSYIDTGYTTGQTGSSNWSDRS